jgi:hypothetical protein
MNRATHKNKHFISPGSYKYSPDSKSFTDQLGLKRLIIAAGIKTKIDFDIRLSLYDQSEAITIEAFAKNVSVGYRHQ